MPIMYIAGIYGAWLFENPNNYNDWTLTNNGEQFCGALNSGDVDVYTFVDENCTRQFNFMCQVRTYKPLLLSF